MVCATASVKLLELFVLGRALVCGSNPKEVSEKLELAIFAIVSPILLIQLIGILPEACAVAFSPEFGEVVFVLADSKGFLRIK